MFSYKTQFIGKQELIGWNRGFQMGLLIGGLSATLFAVVVLIIPIGF